MTYKQRIAQIGRELDKAYLEFDEAIRAEQYSESFVIEERIDDLRISLMIARRIKEKQNGTHSRD